MPLLKSANLVQKQNNKLNLNLIKPLDLTSKFQGTGEHVKGAYEKCNQQIQVWKTSQDRRPDFLNNNNK